MTTSVRKRAPRPFFAQVGAYAETHGRPWCTQVQFAAEKLTASPYSGGGWLHVSSPALTRTPWLLRTPRNSIFGGVFASLLTLYFRAYSC